MRTKLSPLPLSIPQRPNNNSSGAPTAAATTTNHVKLWHPGHKLLFVQCQASGRPFFGRWQLCRHPLAAGPCLMQLKAHQHHPHKRQREPHPKFCSATREISLGGQIFTLSFVHHARLTFGKRQAAAEWEFKALEKAGIINCSTNSPCVKVFARYARVTILSALPH